LFPIKKCFLTEGQASQNIPKKKGKKIKNKLGEFKPHQKKKRPYIFFSQRKFLGKNPPGPFFFFFPYFFPSLPQIGEKKTPSPFKPPPPFFGGVFFLF